MPAEHPRPVPTETPEGPPREHPRPTRPEYSGDGSPERGPADGSTPDPIDRALWSLTYRSAELVASIVGLLAEIPTGAPVELVEETSDGATSTIRNTIGELAQAGILHRTPTGILKLTPLGRAWALGAINPKIAPLPRIEHRTQDDGTLRIVWRRPTLDTLHKISNPENPTTRTQEVHP